MILQKANQKSWIIIEITLQNVLVQNRVFNWQQPLQNYYKMILIFLFLIFHPFSTNAMEQELYKRMVFPFTSTTNQMIQKAETKLECGSKCLFMSTNCSIFFFDLKKKECIVSKLEQLKSFDNSSFNKENILGYVSMG